jgi:predicted aspartyl protease
MAIVQAPITFINGDDLSLVRRKMMDPDEVKQMTVNMLVDTGAINLCINESVQEQMQFPVVDKRKAQLANGSIIECNMVGSVEVRF